MFEWIEDEYRFVGYTQGFIMVYIGEMHVDIFSVYSGIKDMDTLINESKNYLKFVKQKY